MPVLLEFEAKRIFRKERIAVPLGDIASTPKKARKVADLLGKPVAVKVQIPTGRRGRAGGIKFAETGREVEKIAEDFLGKKFLDHQVNKVLVEKQLKIKREFYLGVVNDRVAKAPTAIVSSVGGIEVEEITQKLPDKISKSNINIWKGLEVFQARKMAKEAGVPADAIRGVSDTLSRLYRNVYRKYDAVYTEINPLCLTEDDRLIAADARLFIDDNAMRRHKDVKPESWKRWNERERFAHEKGFGYVELNTQGEIACIANGAGLGMSVMDLINEATKMGTLACFLDIGGRFYELAGEALKMVSKLPNLKAVLIHSYGGLTRQNILADGLCHAIKELKPKYPVFIELSGTGERGAIEVMRKWSPEFRRLGVTVEWSSHIATGTEDPSARKGGVDVIETPVKRVVEWSGLEYRRSPPDWLLAKTEWEEITRKLMKECMTQRPEKEYRELAKYE